ncbi:MAG TPA: Imm49 family immunity protein [Fibrobacteria bacterium]|nr:Imm49 family immunity protein [Fibrobacteria bacterium]
MAPAEKATGKAEPFFDALACNDAFGVRQIAAASPDRLNPDLEYEEDLLYMRALMDLDAGVGDNLPNYLARWKSLSEGRLDLRLDIVRALSERNEEAFNFGLGTLMGELRDEYEKGARKDVYLQEDLQTVLRLSVEGLALARLAERAGMIPDREFPLMPAVARIGEGVVSLPDDAWIP